tara:strand:- start:2975 stop:3754 length:780 start_codon:yes stop_codon:yes gene_type:complete
MVFIRGKGRMRRSLGTAKLIEAIYRKNNIAPVITEDEAPEQTVSATDNNFTLNFNVNIMNEFSYNLPFPEQHENALIALINACEEKVFGSYVFDEVNKMDQKTKIKAFVSLMYKIENTIDLKTLIIPDTEIIEENAQQNIYDVELETKLIRELIEVYSSLVSFVQKGSKYFIECRDASGNIFGYSRSFLFAENFKKPLQLAATINDTTSSSKDGFNLNEEFFLNLNVNSPNRKKLLFTSTSNLALDKGTISINSLTLQE